MQNPNGVGKPIDPEAGGVVFSSQTVEALLQLILNRERNKRRKELKKGKLDPDYVPFVRAQNNGELSGKVPPIPPFPTQAKPGTESKIRVMMERGLNGFHLHHPEDAKYFPDHTIQIGTYHGTEN